MDPNHEHGSTTTTSTANAEDENGEDADATAGDVSESPVTKKARIGEVVVNNEEVEVEEDTSGSTPPPVNKKARLHSE